MNIKKDIREKLNKYLDKKVERGDPYIFNEVVNFIKKDRKEQLILHGVSQQRELLLAFLKCYNNGEVTEYGINEVDDFLKHNS